MLICTLENFAVVAAGGALVGAVAGAYLLHLVTRLFNKTR